MTDKQPDPLFLADQCEAMAAIWANEVETRQQAATLLRTQHAAIERKDALLRQALEMLGCTHEDDDPGHRCGHCDDYVDRNGILRAAIKQELSQ